MPMSKWAGSSKGLIEFKGDKFSINLDVQPEDMEIVHQWTKQICEYRLHAYFERKEKSEG